MRTSILTELASKPDLISGIYNFCDRWCERCPLTSRCLVYATEQEDLDDAPESNDIRNEAFWTKLDTISQQTKEMIVEWAKELGVDLNVPLDEEWEKRRTRKRMGVDSHPLTRAGKKYANDVAEWFRAFDQVNECSEQALKQLEDAREVIEWYQYQIAVKTMRALSGSIDEAEFELDVDEYQRDSDGSAKVALIGIDRSIAAWRMVQLTVPDRSDSMVPLMLQLDRLRSRIEKKFPQARGFVRPGFDELLATDETDSDRCVSVKVRG